MEEKNWKRNCPKCGKLLIYKNKKSIIFAIRHNSICLSCARTIYPSGIEYKKCCPVCRTEYVYKNRRNYIEAAENNSKCHKCANPIKNIGPWERNCPICKRKLSYKTKRSYLRSLNLGLRCNKCVSDATRKKLRDAKIKWLLAHNPCGSPACNKTACNYLDNLSKQRKWNLQHALNGGEKQILGYHVDGYGKKRNIVIEYDERQHYTSGKLKQRDIDRMNKIIGHIGCKFYRYNELTGELRKYA